MTDQEARDEREARDDECVICGWTGPAVQYLRNGSEFGHPVHTRADLAGRNWKHPEPEVTDARLRSALEAAWDGGNASGLDGWVGPGRGTEPVDDVAIYQRQRDVDAVLRSWVPVGEGERP